MVLIYIYLEEGFIHEFVEIFVNNKKYYQNNNVTTKAVLGLADTAKIEIAENSANIKFFFKNKKLSKIIPINVSDSVHIAISLTEHNIVYRVSEHPFEYM